MKLKSFILSALLIFSLGSLNTARAGLGAALGETVAKEVLKAVIGKGLSELFGGDKPTLTKEDVENAIANGFNHASLQSIQTEVSALNRDFKDYVPTSFSDTVDILDRMRGDSSKIQSGVLTHMSKGNFHELAPSYVTAANMRMLLIAEMRRLNYKDSKDDDTAKQYARVIASAAHDAISDMYKFYTVDYTEPNLTWSTFRDQNHCIIKNPDQHYYNQFGQKMGNKVTKYPMPPFMGYSSGVGPTADVSTKWCPRQQGEVYTFSNNDRMGSKIEVWQVISDHVYKIPQHDFYSVLYRVKAANKEGYTYRYAINSTKERAQINRAVNSTYSPVDNIEGQIASWFEIVMASGTSSEKLSAAKHASLFLGISDLKHRVSGVESWYKSHILPGARGQ